MARSMTRSREGVYRAVGIWTSSDGEKFTKVEGPYLTPAAAKAAGTRIQSSFAWMLNRQGGHVETWIEKVKDPTWVPVVEEIKL